jgi:hypothetical protein
LGRPAFDPAAAMQRFASSCNVKYLKYHYIALLRKYLIKINLRTKTEQSPSFSTFLRCIQSFHSPIFERKITASCSVVANLGATGGWVKGTRVPERPAAPDGDKMGERR